MLCTNGLPTIGLKSFKSEGEKNHREKWGIELGLSLQFHPFLGE
jgi:hypothetical protein